MAWTRPALTTSWLVAFSALAALTGCQAFTTLGPEGCDAQHACTDPARPRCDVQAMRCLPAAPQGDGGGDSAAPLMACQAHADCPGAVCDEFGVVTGQPGRCIPAAQVATVHDAAELRAALTAHGGIVLAAGAYEGAWQLFASVVLVGPRAVNNSVRSTAAPAMFTGPTVGPVIQVTNQAQVTLDGITVGGATGSQGHGILCDAADDRLFLRRVEVSDNDGIGIWARCPLFVDQSIVGTMQGTRGNLGGGVLAEAQVTLTNSFITNNGSNVSAVGGVQVNTTPASATAGSLLAELTFVDNWNSNVGNALNCDTAGTMKVWQSLFWNNMNLDLSDQISGCEVHLAAAAQTDQSDGEGVVLDMNNPPQFVGFYDLHLMPTSPGVDDMPSDPDQPLLDHDIDGDPRPLGKSREYGADEVVPM